MQRLLSGFASHTISMCLLLIPFNVYADGDRNAATIERIQLKNDTLAIEITSDIGGRVLSLALHGQPNFLLVNEQAVNQPAPVVTPTAHFIGYMGHETWVGPQSQWWQHQQLNAERRAAKAVWPPDPYLILSAHQIKEKNARQVIMQSPDSPVSGVRLQKQFALVEGEPNKIHLQVSAENIRDTSVAWDIWFNTRVPHTTAVYVPVADESDVRVQQITDDTYGPVTSEFDAGLWSLVNAPSPTHDGRRGKAFIQPTHGWMAAFRDQQVLIIQFPLEPKSSIHPEQGQIELYQEFRNGDNQPGMLELEVHAPYRTLAPGAAMRANETWWLMAYSGEQNAAAQRAFLRNLPALWK